MGLFCLPLQADDEGKEKPDPVRPHGGPDPDNQKLNLLAAVLDMDDWRSAEFLLQALEPILPAAYVPVAKAFCRHIHRLIDALYRRVQASRVPEWSIPGIGFIWLL